MSIRTTETGYGKKGNEQKKSLGDMIYECMEKEKMRPSDLADYLGCRYEKVSRLLNNAHRRSEDSRPDRRIVLALAATFREYSKQEWIYAAYPEERIYDEIYIGTTEACLRQIDDTLCEAGYHPFGWFHKE